MNRRRRKSVVFNCDGALELSHEYIEQTGGVGKTARALSLATGRVWTILKSNGLDEDAHSDHPTVGVMLFRASTAELHTHTHTHKIGKERR